MKEGNTKNTDLKEEKEIIESFLAKLEPRNILSNFSDYIRKDTNSKFESNYINSLRNSIKQLYYEIYSTAIKIEFINKEEKEKVQESDDYNLVLNFIQSINFNTCSKERLFKIIMAYMVNHLKLSYSYTLLEEKIELESYSNVI